MVTDRMPELYASTRAASTTVCPCSVDRLPPSKHLQPDAAALTASKGRRTMWRGTGSWRLLDRCAARQHAFERVGSGCVAEGGNE
jgi:hypothetical protein